MALTHTDQRIRIALPNKGRLSERALELFEQAGLKPAFRVERALVASLGDDFQAIFVRAADVPEYLADGAADLGVTGLDLVEESGRDVEQVLDLRFGRCRMVVAVRDDSTASSAIPRARLDEVRKVIPGLSGPTIVEVLDSGTWVETRPVARSPVVPCHCQIGFCGRRERSHAACLGREHLATEASDPIVPTSLFQSVRSRAAGGGLDHALGHEAANVAVEVSGLEPKPSSAP